MKILIFAGGTGSIALQTGIYEFLQKHQITQDVQVKVLVNAYDNGLSTGVVRQVMGGKILGPSDVRKNQTTRLRLENPASPWLRFLDIRFSAPARDAEQYCLDQLAALETAIGVDRRTISVRGAIREYFNVAAALQVDYADFSLANIIYAGFARASGHSLRRAAAIMSGILNIADNVILNDDHSLYLGAITQSGIKITDEGDIVGWGNLEDPIVDLFFTDHLGTVSTPQLCDEAAEAIQEADLIILSTGTQWSSLIPTYASSGFQSAITKSKAAVVMVMNRVPDLDSPGQGASDIIKLLVPRYFPEGVLRVVLDPSGHEIMNHLDRAASRLVKSVHARHGICGHAGNARVHAPDAVAGEVMAACFQEFLTSKHFMFDYDDTLVARGNRAPQLATANIALLSKLARRREVSVCTGNSIKAIKLQYNSPSIINGVAQHISVFADGGVNQYTASFSALQDQDDDQPTNPKFVGCLDKSSILEQPEIDIIIQSLLSVGIPLSKIESRGAAMVCVKPIDPEYRPLVEYLVQSTLQTRLSHLKLHAKSTGRSTIEIARAGISKLSAVRHVLKVADSITFLGDEFATGNDRPVVECGLPTVKFLPITSTAMTAVFLATLLGEVQ